MRTLVLLPYKDRVYKNFDEVKASWAMGHLFIDSTGVYTNIDHVCRLKSMKYTQINFLHFGILKL